MVTEKIKKGVSFKDLGIGQTIESDRLSLDARGAMQITKYLIDTKTQYYDKNTGEGGILKFNAFDTATGEPVKYYTTSKVLIENFKSMSEVVGFKEEQDENGQVWNVFKEGVDIDGIEMIPSKVKGHKPYPKIIIKD